MHNFNFKYADFMSRILKDCFEPKANKQKPKHLANSIFNKTKAKFICIKSHDFIQTFTLFKFYNSKQ